MKSVLLILAAVCLSAQAAQVPTHTASKTLLNLQKEIYELFWHVDQPTIYMPKLIEKSRTFNIVDNVKNYEDQVRRTSVVRAVESLGGQCAIG